MPRTSLSESEQHCAIFSGDKSLSVSKFFCRRASGFIFSLLKSFFPSLLETFSSPFFSALLQSFFSAFTKSFFSSFTKAFLAECDVAASDVAFSAFNLPLYNPSLAVGADVFECVFCFHKAFLRFYKLADEILLFRIVRIFKKFTPFDRTWQGLNVSIFIDFGEFR